MTQPLRTEPALTPASPDRKTAILDAALQVFGAKGIEGATIDDIRSASGASVGSIYHHFGTKEGIAAALFADGFDQYWRALLSAAQEADTAQAVIYQLVSTHITWITTHPELARFLLSRRQAISPEHEQALRARTASHFKGVLALFKPWLEQGILRRLPSDLYAPLLMGPAQELSRQWLSGRIRIDPRQVVNELADAAWRSLAVNP